MCLLHALSRQGRLAVVGCHIDHGLRPGSRDDARLVERVTGEWGLECAIKGVDTRGLMASEGLSMELAARKLRYEALRSTAAELGIEWIALGHTSDDQVETVLMHVLRGAGIAGAAGMRALQGDLFRPLLTIRHWDTVMYCGSLGIPFVLDPQNEDLTLLRNRVRHELLPAIAQIFPGAREALLRLADSSARDADYLEALSGEALSSVASQGEPIPTLWSALPESLQYHSLRLLNERSGHPVSSRILDEQIAELRSRNHPASTAALLLPPMFNLGPTDATSADRCVPLVVPGRTWMDGGVLDSTIWNASETILKRATVASPHEAYLDLEVVGEDLRARRWRSGDRIRPPGLDGTKKLQDIFVDKKIPREERHRLWILEAEGSVIWVPGVVLDGKAAVSSETKDVLHLSAYTPSG